MLKNVFDEACRYIERYLHDIHQVDDVDWQIFMAPFTSSFISYYQMHISSEPSSSNIEKIIIPYANNDFITSLEEQSYYYHLLSSGQLPDDIDKVEVVIAVPKNKYINKYIFPFSNSSKMGFLSFPNKIEKLLFYFLSAFQKETCRLDWLQETPELNASSARKKLYEMSIKEFGDENKDLLGHLVYMLPSIYMENFSFYYEKAKLESDKLKKMNVIYFIRHFLFNPTFSLLLSLKSIQSKKRITFQHGAVYGQTKAGWSEKVEKKFASHFLTWGYRYDKEDVPFVSLRIKKSIFPNLGFFSPKKNILIVLPVLFREDLIDKIKNSIEILANILEDDQCISIRFDPREKNQDIFLNTMNEHGVKYEIDKDKRKLLKVAVDYQSVVFITPNATGYLELINQRIFPYMVFCENDYAIREESLELYNQMKEKHIWMDFDNLEGASFKSMSSEQKKAIKEFKKRFVRTSFCPSVRLNLLLLKYSKEML
jgi:hypothetical protein